MYKDHRWFVSALADLIMRLKYYAWKELMAAVGDIQWIEETFQVECDKLYVEVALELRKSSVYIFTQVLSSVDEKSVINMGIL